MTIRISNAVGCAVGCIINMAIILTIYNISSESAFNVMLASFIAYPFASMASKYATLAFRKYLREANNENN